MIESLSIILIFKLDGLSFIKKFHKLPVQLKGSSIQVFSFIKCVSGDIIFQTISFLFLL